MAHRFVSIVLSLALLICPLACSLGSCQAAECCAIDGANTKSITTNTTPDSVENEKSCCCGNDKKLPDDSEQPEPPADDSECQGICGGAVPHKMSDSEELTHHTASDCVLSPVVLPQASYESPKFRLRIAEDKDCYRGISLRTLFMSLIC
ncbi:hypothetical protein AB1L42_12655 [Thalassoglobus sp. JC818]|uniref:hypothetical protein n=1 Tax=Thalassoglobus sp. JC818 TaxID=3232136 RepID=UPI0034593E67